MTDRRLRVLSIDGGGVRAHLAALLLAELERLAKRPVSELFDLVVGTSTGGLLAMGVAVGIPAVELAEFFPRCGARIFGAGKARGRVTLEQRLENSSQSLGAFFRGGAGGSRHRPDGLESVLRDVFGEASLAQVDVPLAVTSVDATASVPVVLSSRDAVGDPLFDLSLVDVGRAATAATGVFPPHVARWAGSARPFTDGAVWANNPTTVALSEAVAMADGNGLAGLVMVSLGTGAAPGTSIADLNRTWLGAGAAGLASTAWAGEVLARRALDPSRFHRLQVVDRRLVAAMDDASPARLAALGSAAADFIASHAADVDAAVSQLAPG